MYPTELKYMKTHEWVKPEGEFATVGITAFAIEALTDLTYLQFNVDVGDTLSKGSIFGVVESVKATSDLYMPVAGEVVAVHKELEKKLEELVRDPYQLGWMVKIRPSNPKEFDTLLSAPAYEKHTQEAH